MLRTLIFSVLLATGIFSTLAAQKQITGTVISRNGNSFTIKFDKCESLPSTNDTCEVSKDISGNKNPFGIMIQSGWMSVANAVFVSRNGNAITFFIIKETSNIVVNGEKKEHFEKGKKIKIVWP